jgi:type VI secretion system FHA domain protein
MTPVPEPIERPLFSPAHPEHGGEVEPAPLFKPAVDLQPSPQASMKPAPGIPQPRPQPVQMVDESVLLQAFLQGAGVAHLELPQPLPDTMRRLGLMFRKLVIGTVAVLRSRADFKSLFRVNMTVIRATNNNPLKFTVSTEDVLQQLLQNKGSGFLDSIEAIDEGFDDIMNHQLAMQAGIQAALNELLQDFNPAHIEKRFEEGLFLQKKAKCWESYQDIYKVAAENAMENFFGDTFVKAYEQQMRALTAARQHDK